MGYRVTEIFFIDTNGNNYMDMFDFNKSDGAFPYGSLVLTGHKFYGMTSEGGPYDYGTVFSIDTNGNTFKNLFYFNDTNGGGPQGDLTPSGNVFYGLTEFGGTGNIGVVFKIDTNAVAGINELKANSGEVKLFPNPSSGKFTIQLAKGYQQLANSSLVIYNMLGEKIYSHSFNIEHSTLSINISGQPAGIYLYRVITQAGELVSEGKFVIQ